MLYPFLTVAFTGPWAPHDANRWVMLFEVVSIAGGIAGLYGIVPRLAWVERQSPRAIRARDAAASAVDALLGPGAAAHLATRRLPMAHAASLMTGLERLAAQPPTVPDPQQEPHP